MCEDAESSVPEALICSVGPSIPNADRVLAMPFMTATTMESRQGVLMARIVSRGTYVASSVACFISVKVVERLRPVLR